MCLAFLAVAAASGVWAVRAWQSTEPGGALVLAGALIVLRLALVHGREWSRLGRLAIEEEAWEVSREPEIKL